MGEPFSWPALAGSGDLTDLPERLNYERAVWGKVHGSPSDYRWIAASPGFDPSQERLEDAVILGPEEEPPGPFPLWRAIPSGHLAVLCSPGRSLDAAGRKAPLVKQVIRWECPEAVPVAVGALLLLRHTETFDDSLWLDGEAPAGGGAIPLDPADEMPVTVTKEKLLVLWEEGIEHLRKSVSPANLAAFYASLLAGDRPAILPTIGKPLSPQALAALLLPLDPDRARALSLAGWIPSRRARRGALGAVWDGVAAGHKVAIQLRDPKAEPPAAEIEERGHRLAEALLMADPAALKRRGSGVARRGAGTTDSEADVERPIQLAMWGPSAAGKTIFLARLANAAWADAGPWEVWPTEGLIAYSQAMRDRIDSENRFPLLTGATPESIAYQFERKTDGLTAVLALEDRAGYQWQELRDDARETLERADGILLMIDPLRDPAIRDIEIRNTLDRLAVARGGKPDERPLAVCLSKADLLMESPEDLRLALEEPDRFVRPRLSRQILAVLDQFHADYRLFPVSAVGVRLRWGVVEPAVFYDEALSPRIYPGAEPVHLVTPFAWLLDRAAARREEVRP
jgi:hypothetical protein